VSPEQFAESMREEVEQYLKQVMEAVNQAPDGAWISGSEEQVRDIAAAMRQRIFQKAVQGESMRRKPLFPPPHDPTTKKRLGCCQRALKTSHL
jgi:hypothetical protein